MDYEILVRAKPDGSYSGGHSIPRHGDDAEKISDAQWPDVCASINVAALARVDALEAELVAIKAEFAAFKTNATGAVDAADAMIKDEKISDKDTLTGIGRIVTQMRTPIVDRARAEYLARAEEFRAKAEALG